MKEVKFYNPLNNKCEDALEMLEKAKEYYQDDPETQRAFVIAKTNIETALMWITSHYKGDA